MSKIVIIGAGSIAFSRGLLADIVMANELNGSTVALCDIDPEGLELTTRLARRMVTEAEADVIIESSMECTDVLHGADYVIQTIAIGGKSAWEKDLNIPLKYGIVQPVGDSVGPGGISRALRLLPVVVDICHDMEDICPNALLLNYSNPNSCVCSAIHQYSNIRAVGLCRGLPDTQKELANYLGIPVEETSVLAVGVNNFNWILEFNVQGQDGLAMLRDKFDIEGVPDNMQINANLFRTFGAYPTPDARHVAEFVSYFLNHEADYGRKYSLGLMKAYGQSHEHWDEIRTHLDGYMPVERYLKRSEEMAISLIVALESSNWEIKVSSPDDPYFKLLRYFDAVNVPNYGLVTNLPEGAILEIPAIVSHNGVRGVFIGDIPHGISTMLSQRIYQQNLTMEAAINGDRQMALQAMLLDPLVSSVDIAEDMLDELLEAHEENLPRFYDMNE
jgi:alpha-galactosidase